MKRNLKSLCILIFTLVCTITLGISCFADADQDGFSFFANELNYASHHYGTFDGLTRTSDDSVRILAKTANTSSGHIGFMFKKEAIEALVEANFVTVSFKITTESYESGDVPGFANIYASGISVNKYHISMANGTPYSNEDIAYASGSVVEIDLVKLLAEPNFSEGLKFILKTAAASGHAANAPAYLVMSDFKFTKSNPSTADAKRIVEMLSSKSSYSSHHYGGFGGVTRLSDGSVRILADKTSTSAGHIGFMINKETIENMVEEDYTTISFKITTEAYESNPVPGYIDVYVSGVKGADYQLSADKATAVGNGVDLVYPSGSVVEIDLIELIYGCNFSEGVKFILPTAPASGKPAGAPAYLVMSDFKATKKISAKTPFEQMLFADSYGSHENGEFGGVFETGENSVKVLAKKKNSTSGFMLTKFAVESLLKLRVNVLTVTLNTVSNGGGISPEYVVLESAASDYVENCEKVATKIDGDKLYFKAGTEITLRLDKLYADITHEKGLEFTLLNTNSFADGGDSAYLVLDNMYFAEKWQDIKYDLVATNGDFVAYYENEPTWLDTTKLSIKAVADAGFDYIDLSLYRLRGDSDLMQVGWEDIILDLKEFAEDTGVEFRLAHSPGYPIVGSDEWINTNKRCVDICEMLGIERIVVHPVVSASKEVFFTNNAKYFGYILPYAKEHGIDILCENSTSKNTGSGWFINDGDDMREFIKLVQSQGHTNFHGCWDTGHGNCEGSQYLDIIALGDEMHAIHFHDNLGTDSHMIPYYGNMDIDEVMRALKVIGYSGDFTLETDGSNRIGSVYTGPALEEGLNPYTKDRFEQQRIIFQIMTYILRKYDSKVLFEEGDAGYVKLRAVTDLADVSIFVVSYNGGRFEKVTEISKDFTMKNPTVEICIEPGDKIFVWDDNMMPLADVYTAK